MREREAFQSRGLVRIACPRWVLSTATVSSNPWSAVVKNPWNRQRSNRVSWPARLVVLGVKVSDPAHHQSARDMVGLLLCGERDLGDLGP